MVVLQAGGFRFDTLQSWGLIFGVVIVASVLIGVGLSVLGWERKQVVGSVLIAWGAVALVSLLFVVSR